MSKDPILFAGGDVNLYGYVLEDPVNKLDMNGKTIFDALNSCYEYLPRAICDIILRKTVCGRGVASALCCTIWKDDCAAKDMLCENVEEEQEKCREEYNACMLSAGAGGALPN